MRHWPYLHILVNLAAAAQGPLVAHNDRRDSTTRCSKNNLTSHVRADIRRQVQPMFWYQHVTWGFLSLLHYNTRTLPVCSWPNSIRYLLTCRNRQQTSSTSEWPVSVDLWTIFQQSATLPQAQRSCKTSQSSNDTQTWTLTLWANELPSVTTVSSPGDN
jgi:hypothetical protein